VTHKVDLSITTYFSAMRDYADEMAAAGIPLDDDDIMSYILNGLDADYNSLIELVNMMVDPISPEILYSSLLDMEVRLASQKAQWEQKDPYQMMANTTTHGGNDNKQHRDDGGNKNNNRGYLSNRGGFCRNNGGSWSGNRNNPYKDH
jgi:hypothetical protein